MASPTPQQCDRIKFFCKVSVSCGAIFKLASLPNPVFTPYTAADPAAALAICAAAQSTPLRAEGSKTAGASLRNSRSNCASDVWPGIKISGVKVASKHTGVQGGCPNSVRQFRGMLRVPDAQIGTFASRKDAAIFQPQREGGVRCGALQRL